MAITAKELAKKLGLSQAAVSIALNNKSGVSTKTRQMVLDAAEKYGYDFSKTAVKNPSYGSIYFVIYRKHGAIVADNPFFSELTEGIQEGCKEKNYRLNILYLYEDDGIASQIDKIICSDCVGIILLGTEMNIKDPEPFYRLSFPIVLLDAYFESMKCDCVLINNVQGASLATDYLIQRTRKQPGYLHSAYSITNFEERAQGFYESVRKNGYATSNCIVHRLSPSVEGAFADMIEIIERGEPVASCYFADNDTIALGAIKAFQKKRFRIPEDIAIIGFDNLPMCRYVSPTLTTINVPKKYMAQVAVGRLIQTIADPQFVPIKIEITTNLVKRQSV